MISDPLTKVFSGGPVEFSNETEISKAEWINEVLKKPKDVFKTRQVYYSLMNDGKMAAKLSMPRPLNSDFKFFHKTHSIKWPLNFEILPERIIHINKPPRERERLYKPMGDEFQPPVSNGHNNTVVFQYEPMVGKFFTTSKINTSTGHLKHLSNDPRFLQFESRFECGNLSKAICTGPNEYELYLRPDLFTKRYTQWFYFRVQNTENSGTYRFTIVNFYKSTSLFGQGMKPLMYSEKMAKLTGIGWRRVGSDISYYQTKFMEPVENKLQPRSKSDYRGCTTYSLTWKFNFPYPNDAVYFAACYPYTYTQLQEYLSQLAVNSTTKRICEQTILCYTLANNPVPLLTITEPCKDEQQFDQKSESTDHSQSTKDQSSKKRCVVITARVHPGETQGSWMMKGLMDFLISEDPDAQILRSNFVFKLVPMLNPDGVIVGNYRCSLSGCDLNRKYTSDLKRFFPTIWHTKQMIIDVMKQYEVVVYCDLHGHSRKQQVFIYGCKNQTPENRFCSRIFPAMLGKNIPELFNFDKCKFSVQKEKEGTGRIVMWREGIMNSYTLEATFCGTAGDDLEAGYHFNSFDFEKIGSHFCDTLLDYIDPDHQKTEYIQQYLKDRVVALKMSRLNASDEDLLTSDDSMSDSSDTGSDSSNCDELPAYYAYLLQKPKKKIKRKSRTLNAKRDEKIKSINKKEVGTTKEGSIGHCAPFLHRFTTLLRDKVCPVCGTYACQKGLKVVEESLKMRKQTHEKSESKKAFQERNNQLWKPLEGQQSGYVSDGVIPPDLISLKPYYDDINKVDHCVGIPVYQYSASSYGTLNRGHSGSKYQKFKRKENLKHVYDFTYQNLELPKIDIGSECFTNRLIHVRRARSAPSEHILITNKRFDLPHFNTDGESVHFNSYGNRIISTEDTNGYITGFPNLSDVYFKDQLTSSHIPTIKNSCSHQKSQTNYLQDESPSQLFDRKQLISNKLFMNRPPLRVSKSFSSKYEDYNKRKSIFNEFKYHSMEKTVPMRSNENNSSYHIRKELHRMNVTNSSSHFRCATLIPKSNIISPQNSHKKAKICAMRRLSCGLKNQGENMLNTISLDVKPIPIFKKRNP